MQKLTWIGLLVLLSWQVMAQEGVKIGFRFAPILSNNYVDGRGRFAGTLNNGPALQASLGPVADFFFAEKYAFSTGLLYTVKRAGFTVPKAFFDDIFPGTGLSREANYNLQYLQVPVTIKLFTNELVSDTKLYIQFGGSAEVKLAEKPLNRSTNVFDSYFNQQTHRRVFGFGDASLVLGVGAEYDLGHEDAVFVTIIYNRGLVNVMRDKDILSKNNLFGLEIGVKF